MSPEEYAALFTFDIETADLLSPRSQQTASGLIGISDLGTCRQMTLNTIRQTPVSSAPNKLAAIVGNYVDEGVKKARQAARPDLMHNVAVQVELPNGVILPGTADEVDVEEPSVSDVKTKDAAGLAAIRRLHSPDNHRWQRHLYYAGLVQAGILPERGIVRNIYLDRSGKDPRPHVEQEAFSWGVVEEASAWLDDVIYAHRQRENTVKDKPYDWCESYCPFFRTCRANDTAVGAVITDPRVEAAAALYVDAKQREQVAAAEKEGARAELEGHNGNAGEWSIRWTTVNAKTGPYQKVAVRRAA